MALVRKTPAESASKRPKQVADLIQQHIAIFLKRDVSDPRLAKVVLTGVDVSPDLKQARILYTYLGGIPEDKSEKDWVKETGQVFSKAAGFLRSLLAESVQLRHVPKLFFVYDPGSDVHEHMAKVLKDL